MKISEEYKSLGAEIRNQRKIYERSQKVDRCFYSTPEVVDYGLMNVKHPDENVLNAYMIMPRYGRNIEHIFEKCGFVFSKATILNIGLAVISLLEQVHSAGYCYNDLKLDNLLVGFGQKFEKYDETLSFVDKSINLVDFGFSSRFVDKKTGKHLP